MSIQELFSRIKQLSLNPKDEIYARNFLIDQSKEICHDIEEQDKSGKKAEMLNCQYLIVPQDTINACGVTATGLLVAMHGSQYAEKTEININRFRDEMYTNAESLRTNTKDAFFTYDMSFEGHVTKNEGSEGHSIAHNFIVIQYKDSDNAIRYRFFQSYVRQHSLKEFIESAVQKNFNNDLSQEEFNQFLKMLDVFVNANSWTNEIEKFHQRYFNVETKFTDWQICKSINFEFKNDSPKITIIPGTIQFQVEKRLGSVNKALEHSEVFPIKKVNQDHPKIICLSRKANSNDEALLAKLMDAPIPKDKRSTISILFHDPVSGEYHYKSVNKTYLKTIQAFESFGGKDKVVYYSHVYDPSLSGKATVHSTLFAETRALFSGKRKLFANTRAFIEGKGSLFADTRALLNGTRPLFASVRRSLGMISSEDIKKSVLGVERVSPNRK